MIRLHNAKILSMVPGQEMFDGEVWVEGNRIKYVGPKKEGTFERRKNCRSV